MGAWLTAEREIVSAALERPAAKLGLVCAALVAGEAVGLSLGRGMAAWPVVAGLAFLVAAFGFGHRLKFWHVLFCFLLGLSLSMRTGDLRRRALSEIELQNGPFVDAFDVKGEPRIGKGDADGMRWVSFPTTFAGGKLDVIFHQSVTNAAPHVGEAWRCAGWLDRRAGRGRSVRQLWVKGRGSIAVRERAANPHALPVLLARAKRSLSRRLGIGLEDRPLVADLNRAMVLGERAALPWEVRQDFIRSGTMHVFAISGLHVMVVAHVILIALVLTLFPIRWAGLVLVPLLWLYVALIGSPASAVRAAAMASVYCAAPILYRRPDSLMAWEVTLIGFALTDPVGLFGVGSMLSFTVMLGILLFIRWAKPFGSRLLMAVGFPFAAWAAGVPIAAHVFSRVTPGGLVANLVEVPLAGAAVMASICGVAASFVSDALAAHVNNLAALFTEAMSGVSWAVARIPGADFEIEPWSIPLCAAWYVGIVASFLWIRAVFTRRRSSLA